MGVEGSRSGFERERDRFERRKVDGMEENVRWTMRALERHGNYEQHGQWACIRTRGTRVDGGGVLRMLERNRTSPPTDVAAKKKSWSIGSGIVK